jgi:hypothetical protein
MMFYRTSSRAARAALCLFYHQWPALGLCALLQFTINMFALLGGLLDGEDCVSE